MPALWGRGRGDPLPHPAADAIDLGAEFPDALSKRCRGPLDGGSQLAIEPRCALQAGRPRLPLVSLEDAEDAGDALGRSPGARLLMVRSAQVDAGRSIQRVC